MTPENFCFWLKGHIELTLADDIVVDMTPTQMELVSDTLDQVLGHSAPMRPRQDPQATIPQAYPLSGSILRTDGPYLDPTLEMDDSDLDPAYQRFIASPPCCRGNTSPGVSG